MDFRLSGLTLGFLVAACEVSSPGEATENRLPPFQGSDEIPPIDLVIPESVEVAVFGLG